MGDCFPDSCCATGIRSEFGGNLQVAAGDQWSLMIPGELRQLSSFLQSWVLGNVLADAKPRSE